MKRPIVCCDGTWQSSDRGVENVTSNVAKLVRAIAKFGRTKGGDFIHPIVFYDASVGTAAGSLLKRGRGGLTSRIIWLQGSLTLSPNGSELENDWPKTCARLTIS